MKKLRLYNGNIQGIVVKMAGMSVSEGCLQKKNDEIKKESKHV